MNKKIKMLIILILGLFIFIPSIKAVDYGQCIKRYGSMSISAGNSTSASKAGSVTISGGNSSWSAKDVRMTATIKARSGYNLTKLYYALGTCTDEITGLDGKHSSYVITVNINHGYVAKLSAWGTMVNQKILSTQKDGEEIRQKLEIGTKRKAASVKFYDESRPAITTAGSGTATVEKVKCDLFKDILNKYWTWVMVLMPIVTILLISFDTLKVIISSDPENGGGKDGNSMTLPKVGSNAIKRMTALVVLMLLPYILSIVFGWFGLDKYWCF